MEYYVWLMAVYNVFIKNPQVSTRHSFQGSSSYVFNINLIMKSNQIIIYFLLSLYLPCLQLQDLNRMQSHETLFSDPARSRAKNHKQTINTNKEMLDIDEERLSIKELQAENQKLKKMLKQAQAKRTHATKECSHLTKAVEDIQAENMQLKQRLRQQEDKCDGQKYRWQQLRFLNKQLSSELQQLRAENESLSQKLRYSNEVLERKYLQLQEKSCKRMQQSVKRVKKAIHYLDTLSAKDIDRTRDLLLDNLRKAIQLLRGKSYEELPCEGEIEQLMSPIRAMQEQIGQKGREAAALKQQNLRLSQQLGKYKSIEKEQIPMFKQAIQKLKKNLIQVRGQLSENQYQKLQLKKKYQQRLKQVQHKYNEVFKECRKMKLQKKIYENRLADLQADVQEEKERLIGENQMLKKLYRNQDSSESRVSMPSNASRQYLPTLPPSKDKKTQQKRAMRKNYSSNQLKTSNVHIKNSVSEYEGEEISEYNEESSALSQEDLKHQIYRIDEEIQQIRKNLTKELEAYR